MMMCDEKLNRRMSCCIVNHYNLLQRHFQHILIFMVLLFLIIVGVLIHCQQVSTAYIRK